MTQPPGSAKYFIVHKLILFNFGIKINVLVDTVLSVSILVEFLELCTVLFQTH